MTTPDIWDCIGRALERELETESEKGGEVPELLMDALALMERGRTLLAKGLQAPVHEGSVDSDETYRAAARNGTPIPQEVLDRMHRDRERSEKDA
jgi:hypothetical protein